MHISVAKITINEVVKLLLESEVQEQYNCYNIQASMKCSTNNAISKQHVDHSQESLELNLTPLYVHQSGIPKAYKICSQFSPSLLTGVDLTTQLYMYRKQWQKLVTQSKD